MHKIEQLTWLCYSSNVVWICFKTIDRYRYAIRVGYTVVYVTNI